MGTPERTPERAAAPGSAPQTPRSPQALHAPRARRIADRLSVQFRVPVEPQFEPVGRRWTLRWYDGPTVDAVRCALARLFPDGAADALAVRRDVTTRALALAAIRETRAGAMHRSVGSWGQRYHLEQLLAGQEHPDRPAGPREAAMLERLLAAATPESARGPVSPDLSRAFDLVARDGVAWLLPEHRLAGPADRDALALTPLEYLTCRYATGVHRTAWESALAVLPVRTAVAAVHGDPQPDPDAARAALALLPVLRAQLSAELDAIGERLAAAAGSPAGAPAAAAAVEPLLEPPVDALAEPLAEPLADPLTEPLTEAPAAAR
ncbi:hypothetical protein [Kitasatospora cineracea]|uniref:Uncharacterized protein n=1 Tax=Kitasatospora cineracea TaxID=88074 RepID=A0A3N4SII7_9ACTN|nr:hypothetical protein [Kitasatospora cineracea]ROR45949.1 hypothetical protein EDD39_4202 [Kitasatospora cineracea]RPE36324.1 hypothetical protein EDD38_4695 [Kitasatospora cineracea]